MPRTIFISYATQDRDLVDPIRRALEVVAQKDDTWTVFQDNRSIRPGEDWEAALYAALEDTAVVVAFLSIPYFNSRYCRIEREVAHDRVFVPVLLRPCPWKDHPAVVGRQVVHGSSGQAIGEEENPDRAHTHVAEVVETLLRTLDRNFARRSLEAAVRRSVVGIGGGLQDLRDHELVVRGIVDAAAAQGGLERFKAALDAQLDPIPPVLRVRLNGEDPGALELAGVDKIDGPGQPQEVDFPRAPAAAPAPALVRKAVERALDTRGRVVQVVAPGNHLLGAEIATFVGMSGESTAEKVRAVTYWPDEEDFVVEGARLEGCVVPRARVLHVATNSSRRQLRKWVTEASPCAVAACGCEPVEALYAHQDHPITVIASDALSLFEGVDPLPLDTLLQSVGDRQRGGASCQMIWTDTRCSPHDKKHYTGK